MCNRYASARGDEAEFERLEPLIRDLFPETPRKIGPFGMGPILRRSAAGRAELVSAQWGMIRPGSRVRKPPPKQARVILTNNARSETMPAKPTYRDAWTRGQRCVIPAWSFDEPNYEQGPKNVWWEFRRADGNPWGIAGLWSDWTDPETGEVVASYTMPTVNVDEHPLMRRMHKPDPALPADKQDKRSIVPLDPGDWSTWLAGTVDDARALLRVPPESTFDAGPAAQVLRPSAGLIHHP